MSGQTLPPLTGAARPAIGGTVPAVLLGAAFFACLYLAARAWQETMLVGVLLATLAALLAAPHVLRHVHGRWEPFDPLVGFTTIVTMGYVVRSLHLLFHEKMDLYHISTDRFQSLDLLATGLSLVILGVVSFYLGYGSRLGAAIGKRLPVFAAQWAPGRTRFVWIAFTVIGGAVYVIFVKTNGGLLHLVTNMELRSETSAGLHVYYLFMRLLPMALLFRQVLMIQSKPSRWARFSFGLHAATVLILLALLGSRSWSVEVLAMILIVRHFLDRPIRMRSLVLIAMSGLLAFAIYFEYRNLTHDGIEAGEVASIRFDDMELFYNGILGGRNFDMMDNLLSIIHYTPDRLPFLEGSSYLHFFVNMVPRSLWEGKPRGVGSILAEKIYGWGFGGAPPGAIGEAYFNYSILGIIPALFLLGLFARTTAAYAQRNRTNPFAVFLLAAAFIFVVMVTRGSLYKVGSTFVMRLVPLLIGTMIACGFRTIIRPGHLPGRPGSS